ncbi:hypothetical protein [Paenibacillus aceti]|uniref:Prophage tail endopeptidase domain-containing protein n=1 Tax=Paenibacillus aceti TaxID=1820010 RepID=A0ABQ1W524_9BACL|nr:hypothetical protein [Paenibacillus aceti]GGG15436.1 hypothetical protein GCM10010913_41680 [Paenibacillus aceti]
MSNATIIQTNSDIFIGSDSATSVLLRGQLYRLDTKATKLFKFDNLVVFCSGNLDYCYSVMNQFSYQSNKNVYSLREILLNSYNGEKIDVVIGEYKDNKTWLYQLSPYNKFDIITYTDIPKDGVNILSAGIKTEESYNSVCKYISIGKSVPEVFKSVFDEISYEGIGGTLTVYRINQKGISEFLKCEVKEKENLNIFNVQIALDHFEKHLIVGERIYGKIWMGVNLALQDEDGVLKFQGSKGEIFDRNGILVMKSGLVAENPDKFGLWSFNDITRVKMDNIEGFVIDRATTDKLHHPDGWEKIMWADPTDGTLYTHDLVAENIKIVNNVGDIILDAENNYLNLGDLSNIIMDNKLTSVEKMQLITELHKIESAYYRMLEQAEKYKRSQRDDEFDIEAQFLTKTSSTKDLYSTEPLTKAFFDLLDYMSQYISIVTQVPLNIDINSPLTEKTSEVPDRAEFILKFKTYYDEEKRLRNLIEDAQFYSGLNMGSFYNNLVIGEYGFIALRSDGKYRSVLNATNGLALQKWEKNKWVNKVYASIGNSSYEDGTLIAEDLVAKRLRIENKFGDVILDSDGLNIDFSVIDNIILDDVITSMEKITLSNTYKTITQQYITLKEQIYRYATTIYDDRDSSYYGLDTAQQELVRAGNELESTYDALTNYMNPIFSNMNATTHIVNDLHSTRFIFHQKWEDFYKAYEGARAKLSDFLEKSSLQLGRNYNNTVIDAVNGVVVTRGNYKNKTTLNATEGIKIERNDGTASSPVWYKVFYVDVDGNLFAEDMSTKRLRILDAKLGDAIIFDSLEGITINGQNDEQIRLNANKGITIDVKGEKRFWIHNDGTLRARKLIIEPDMEDGLVLDEETDGYISDLMVNSLKAVRNSKDEQDYIYIRDNFIKLNTGTSAKSDITKFKLHLTKDDNQYSYPEMIWGQGNGVNGGNIGYIKKTSNAFQFQYNNDTNKTRAIEFNASQGDALRIYAEAGEIKIDSDTKVTISCGGSGIVLSPNGVKITGTRIDLN